MPGTDLKPRLQLILTASGGTDMSKRKIISSMGTIILFLLIFRKQAFALGRPYFLVDLRGDDFMVFAGITLILLLLLFIFISAFVRTRRLNRIIRQRTEKMENILEATGAGTWEWNAQTGEMSVNERWANMLGYTREELEPISSKTWQTLTNQEDLQRVDREMVETLEGDSTFYDVNFRMRHKEGQWIWVNSYGKVVSRTPDGKADLLMGTHMDITEKKKKEAELEHTSYHDHLTGLFNRRYLTEHLEQIDHEENLPIGFLMADLNGLKLINDAFGNHAGDEVLKMITKELKTVCHGQGVLARIGGDEFALITRGKDQSKLEEIKSLIQEKIANLEYQNIQLSIAVGYAIKNTRDTSLEDLYKEAESQMYKRKVLDGSSVMNNAIRGILQTLTDKYKDEKLHSQRVSEICLQIGKALNLNDDDLRELTLAGMLHDIGKISIPDKILGKPGKLNDEEYEIIKSHTRSGYQILRAADEFSDLGVYALTHHEKYDGTGYPNGIKGEEIPLFSRIIAVADAYEAMTADRPYRQAMPKEVAIKELEYHSGTQFDPLLVDVFLNQVVIMKDL